MIWRTLGGAPGWGSWMNSLEEFERMRRQMERLSSGLSGLFTGEPASGVFPLMNVTEDEDYYYVRAELPGIKSEDLDISATGDSLTVSGERKLPDENSGATYHRREREAGRFSRILTLPGMVDSEGINAKMSDGVLTVVLPKAEAAKPKRISVKAA
ncbi:MAG TPA: Hsp20/alpha crystallin family protein [Desulfobacteraceae bacterium]|jgi:HSP20 family protein|nr:Hsp20/alpha crystallin family protein [Desulfobacteraceae bacterium]